MESKNEILLINPILEGIHKIPFGTLPALTGALRGEGFRVIQRDLHIEFMIAILKNDTIINKIREKILERLLAIPEEDEKIHLAKLDYILIYKQKAFVQLNNEIDSGRFTYHTKTLLEEIYNTVINYIHFLIRTNGGVSDLFDCINSPNNLFKFILDQVLLNDIDWSEIKLTGITISENYKLDFCLTLAKLIKEKNPKIHIVFGGDLFNTRIDFQDSNDLSDLKQILKEYADTIIRFEGETILVKLAKKVFAGAPYEDLPQLMFLNKQKQLQVNDQVNLEKVTQLPIYDFEGLPIDYYPGLPVEISRGCYHNKCSFCRFNLDCGELGKHIDHRDYYRSYDTDLLVSRIKYLKEKYNKNFFSFVALAITPLEIRNICKAIIKSEIKIKWHVRVRLDNSLKTSDLNLMAKAGCLAYHFAPETFSEETMRLMNKKFDLSHIKKLISYWEMNRKILPAMTLNVFTAFPGESFTEFMKTYNYVKNSKCDVPNIGFFRLIKNSEVYNNPEKYGIKIERKRSKLQLFKHYEISWGNEANKERKKIESFLNKNKREFKRIKNHSDEVYLRRRNIKFKKISELRFGIFIFFTRPIILYYLFKRKYYYIYVSLKKIFNRF